MTPEIRSLEELIKAIEYIQTKWPEDKRLYVLALDVEEILRIKLKEQLQIINN